MKHNNTTKYKFKEKFDYPLDGQLIEAIKQEYRDESKEKGNSWRRLCSIDYLIGKLQEEQYETLAELSALMNRQLSALEPALEEIKDEILILSMLYQRLQDTVELSKK